MDGVSSPSPPGAYWVDGEIVAAGVAAVSPVDHAIIVGDGVFETLKVVDGVPFALTRHLGRLKRSADGLGLPEPDDDVVRTAVAETLAEIKEISLEEVAQVTTRNLTRLLGLEHLAAAPA